MYNVKQEMPKVYAIEKRKECIIYYIYYIKSMRRILFLSTLAIAMTTHAQTSGSVEVYMKPVTDLTKQDVLLVNRFKGTTFESGLKTQVKVKDSGLSFGANLISTNKSKFFPLILKTDLKKTNAWVKYDLKTEKIDAFSKVSINSEQKVILETNFKTRKNQ